MVESTAVSCIHPVIQTSTIILWTELFPKKRREKIQGEILQFSGVSTNTTRTTVILQELQDFFEYSVFYKNYSVFHTQSSKFPVIPCKETILHTELILLLQEILQLQGSSRAGSFQQLFPVLQAILHGSQHPRSPYSNSQASSTLQNSTRRNRIHSKG